MGMLIRVFGDEQVLRRNSLAEILSRALHCAGHGPPSTACSRIPDCIQTQQRFVAPATGPVLDPFVGRERSLWLHAGQEGHSSGVTSRKVRCV